jgi:hypothetical protein
VLRHLELGGLSDLKSILNLLNLRSQSELSGIYFDKLQRLHFTTPTVGPLHLCARADLFYSSTVETHLQDLAKRLGDKKALLLLNDRGPDWDFHKMLTLVAMCHLWKSKKLVLLVLVAYAAHNRY